MNSSSMEKREARALARSTYPLIERYLRVMYPKVSQGHILDGNAFDIANRTSSHWADRILETAAHIEPSFRELLCVEIKKLVLNYLGTETK